MRAEEIDRRSLAAGYVSDEALSLTLSLMLRLGRPLLVEGEAGVGKTAIAATLAQILERPLIRLQCYEGLDANAAVYEWNYTHQLLSIKLREDASQPGDVESDIFSERFLLERPLLAAIRSPQPAVLLIDEIDRADEAFEAFLLELLAEFQITIPELGTLGARSIPSVVLTSNGTRELSDALRRRCLYHFLDYPDAIKELKIINRKLPGVDDKLGRQVVNFVQRLRGEELRKPPGIAETLDWIRALTELGIESLDTDPALVLGTCVCLLKTREDLTHVNAACIDRLVQATK